MKHGDKHIITSAISDEIELTVEINAGHDLLLLTIENGEHISSRGDANLASENIFINKDAARVLFGLLGQFLHSWER